MKILDSGREKVRKWPALAITLLASLAAFSCYTSMYAFRKAFAAGTFEHLSYLHIDYKVWLVLTQMIGYTLSKFYGIRFIAESSSKKRAANLVRLILISWLALLFFALVPPPWNIGFMLINGFPLGMIWGLVFSYLEGRKATEFMGAVMSISLIFASGFVKTVARTLMGILPINQYWMPFCTGLIFLLPFLLSVYCLELIPAPTKEDQQLRTKRAPMNAAQRKNFVSSFLPGIIITLIIYVLLTILRDMRDNFEVEIWANFKIHDNHIYTKTDTIVSLAVLLIISLLILIRDNLKAFMVIHLIIITGCVLAGVATFIFDRNYIGPVAWMCMVGLGLYMAYIPYNAIFYERMIANFHFKSNVGFIIYICDSVGYLGSASVLIFREFSTVNISWGVFFKQTVYTVSIVGGICAIASLIYFRNKTIYHNKENSTKHNDEISKPDHQLDSVGELILQDK
ncbi:DUF5690 family protein [Mucilaginibacter sp. X5P1]|uniref:DUF5690 family protein n=1 Tax=Mucilaginibacter sp. X5P1 TaxID=2723088 RepID=UPI001619390D|nr:DUF5690 family protein [Mucilaginibacter sp. X5P1]MBB6138263.1 hypothetical protein [Mucilaginibacter sp. X5P1]